MGNSCDIEQSIRFTGILSICDDLGWHFCHAFSPSWALLEEVEQKHSHIEQSARGEAFLMLCQLQLVLLPSSRTLRERIPIEPSAHCPNRGELTGLPSHSLSFCQDSDEGS